MADIKPHIEELEAQLEFMRESLETSRKKLEGAPLVITYDNGGGQTGLRKNPAFEAYNALMKTYNSTISSIKDLTGADNADLPQRGKLLKFESKYRKTG